MDAKLLDILVCPICKGKLYMSDNHQALICRFDKIAYPVENGIPVLLPERAKALTE